MLKWADQTRRKLDSQSDIDNLSISGKQDDQAVDDNRPLSMLDDTSASQKLPPVQRRRKQPVVKRPHSLFVSPEQIIIDWEFQADDDIEKHKDPDLRSSSLASSPVYPDDFDVKNSLTLISDSDLKAIDDDNVSQTSSNSDVLRISTKPQLLKISSLNENEKNTPSFWKNLISKKSWPGKTKRKSLGKSSSMIETYKKIEHSPCLSPNDTENRELASPGLGGVISCDLPKSSSVHRRRSLKAIKRQNENKKPKPFNKPYETETRTSDRSPDSGYDGNRFSSTSGVESSDEESLSTSPSSLSNNADINVFFRDTDESLDNEGTLKRQT